MSASNAFLAFLVFAALFVAAFVAFAVRDWRIEHALDGLDLGDDDAPRDDNDFPPEHRVIRDDQGRIITRLNGEAS